MRSYVSAAFSPARQRDELADPDRVTWLATIDEQGIVGFAAVRRGTAGDGVVASTPVDLHRIYVESSCHGLGVGRRLMDVCVTQARTWAADVLWLGVWERNQRAISFYEQVASAPSAVRRSCSARTSSATSSWRASSSNKLRRPIDSSGSPHSTVPDRECHSTRR